MAANHMLCATTAWAATLAVGHRMGVKIDTASTVVASFAVVTVACLAPDLDKPGSTISRSFYPITMPLAHLVQWISGGHRHGTHWPITAAILSAVALLFLPRWAAAAFSFGYWAHLACDYPSKGGLQLAGPISDRWSSLELFRTGSMAEAVVATTVAATCVAITFLALRGDPTWHQQLTAQRP